MAASKISTFVLELVSTRTMISLDLPIDFTSRVLFPSTSIVLIVEKLFKYFDTFKATEELA